MEKDAENLQLDSTEKKLDMKKLFITMAVIRMTYNWL